MYINALYFWHDITTLVAVICEIIRQYTLIALFIIKLVCYTYKINYIFVANMEIHDKLRTLRISKGYTQDYVASKLNIDPVNYGRLERGQSKITIDRLQLLCQILDVDICNILSTKNKEYDNNLDLLQKIYETEKHILQELKQNN